MAFLTPTVIPTTGANSRSMICGQRPSTLRVRATPAILSKPMNFGVRMSMSERTFIAVKPDGMNRGLLGDIISRFEAKGYQLVGIKTLVPSKQLAETHYAALREKPFFPSLVDFITSGPVCAMVWQGEGVVITARKMIGETNPLASAPGTIRGDFAVDVGRNVIHGSDAVETAEREIGIWFEPSELCNWTPSQSSWIYEKVLA